MSNRATGPKSRVQNLVVGLSNEPQDQIDQQTIASNFKKLIKEGKFLCLLFFSIGHEIHFEKVNFD